MRARRAMSHVCRTVTHAALFLWCSRVGAMIHEPNTGFSRHPRSNCKASPSGATTLPRLARVNESSEIPCGPSRTVAPLIIPGGARDFD